ncbi:MAG: hypothetical protein OXH75_27160, partial [Acidobacteria bacterium]|nr:hypothetical protein [Acidobacteriota bacterium]
RVLGRPPSATGEEIRRRDRELGRAHRPGEEPERFQQITAAYEALKDDRARVKTALLGMAAYGDFELALDALLRARPARREMPGLQTLLAAEGKLHE